MIPASKIKDIHKRMEQVKSLVVDLERDFNHLREVHVQKEQYVSTTAVALNNGVHADTIKRHCRNGRIPGAKKVHGKWLVPYYTNLESLGL